MYRWLLHDVRVLDETGGFTEPVDVTVAGVFKAGVPVVPHPRLAGALP